MFSTATMTSKHKLNTPNLQNPELCKHHHDTTPDLLCSKHKGTNTLCIRYLGNISTQIPLQRAGRKNTFQWEQRRLLGIWGYTRYTGTKPDRPRAHRASVLQTACSVHGAVWPGGSCQLRESCSVTATRTPPICLLQGHFPVACQAGLARLSASWQQKQCVHSPAHEKTKQPSFQISLRVLLPYPHLQRDLEEIAHLCEPVSPATANQE